MQTNQSTQPTTAAEWQAFHKDQIHRTVREYMDMDNYDEAISAIAAAFASHVVFITDDDEDCLTISTLEFKTQAFAITDLICFLATMHKHHKKSTDYAELAAQNLISNRQNANA